MERKEKTRHWESLFRSLKQKAFYHFMHPLFFLRFGLEPYVSRLGWARQSGVRTSQCESRADPQCNPSLMNGFFFLDARIIFLPNS